MDECRHRKTTVEPQVSVNQMQAYHNGGVSYDHLLTPNQAGCYNGPEDLDFGNFPFLIPPSSMHPNGVNVLFADGSVHFITDGISDDVWRALGTRNGHETVSLLF